MRVFTRAGRQGRSFLDGFSRGETIAHGEEIEARIFLTGRPFAGFSTGQVRDFPLRREYACRLPVALDEWQGKVCSTCELFNSPDIAFVPFELCLTAGQLGLADFQVALGFFQGIGWQAAELFKSMAVFDSLIANTDRHVGNFGVLRDNATGAVLGMAPIFDNNVSLFTRDYDEWLTLENMMARMEQAPGIVDATLPWQGRAMLGEAQRRQVERLVDFAFDGSGFIEEYRAAHPGERATVSSARLEALAVAFAVVVTLIFVNKSRQRAWYDPVDVGELDKPQD